jgi:hypothetical protein
MTRLLCATLLVCIGLSTSAARGQDLADAIRDYFPGKWKVEDGDGNSLGHVNWRLVAGDKVLVGPGTLANGGKNFTMSGWDAAKKEWVHTWYSEDGSRGRVMIRKFDGKKFTGGVVMVDADGNAKDGPITDEIIDDNHVKVTQDFDGETEVMHLYRVKEDAEE